MSIIPTEAAFIHKIGTAYLRAQYAQWQALRFAQSGYDRFGPPALDKFRGAFAYDPQAGRVVPVAREAIDPEADRFGAGAAGFVWAERHLAKGLEPAEARRQVLGRMRTLARAWSGSEVDKVRRMKAVRTGVGKAIGRAG